MLTITPIYTALLALLYIALSVRTLRLRRNLGIPIGDNDNPAMLRAMRVHSNFAEYTPLALLLILMVELTYDNPLLIHALGAALLAGRLIHAFGVSRSPERFGFRVAGMALSFFVLAASALTLLGVSAWN